MGGVINFSQYRHTLTVLIAIHAANAIDSTESLDHTACMHMLGWNEAHVVNGMEHMLGWNGEHVGMEWRTSWDGMEHVLLSKRL